MRWVLLGLAVGGFASVWGVVPGLVLFIAFLVMFSNFATFCLLYDRPKDRARGRVAERLRMLHPNSDVHQRLAATPIKANAEDRRLGLGPMTILNLTTGLAAVGLLAWGLVARLF